MGELVLRYAGSAVGLSWQGDLAASLVEFLFPLGQASGWQDLDSKLAPKVSYQVRSDGESGQLTISSSEGENHCAEFEDAAIYLAERVTYHLADTSRAGMLLHAACVARQGRAVLLPGASGSGKSTLAFWLAQHEGYDYLTDELVLIHQGTLLCRGLPRPVHLKKEAGRLYSGLAGTVSKVPSSEVSELRGRMVRAPNTIPQAELRAILFPAFSAGSTFSCQRISGAQAALKLTACLVNARNLPDNGFPELLRLARALPAWELSYPDFEQVPAALDAALVA
jgi:hypothetical protein